MNARLALVLAASLSLFGCALDSGPPPEELAVVADSPATDPVPERFVLAARGGDAGLACDAAVADLSEKTVDPHVLVEDGGAFPLITVPR